MMKILVVDDEVPIRRTIRMILSRMKFTQIREASDGLSAWREIDTYMPDLVIADVKMPGMDGLELLSKIRETGNDLIYIVLSGFDYFEYAQKSINLGAFSYLLKPIDDDVLTKKLIAAESLFKMKMHLLNHEIKMKPRLSDPGILRRHILTDIVNGTQASSKQTDATLKELDFPVPFGKCFVVMVMLETPIVHAGTSSEGYYNIILDKIESLVFSAFQYEKYGIYPFNLDAGTGFVFRCQTSCMETDLNFSKIVEVFKDTLQKIDVSVSVGISKTVMGIDQLSVAYISAKNAITQKFANPNEHVFLSNDTKMSMNAMIIDFSIEQKILSSFEKNDKNAAQMIISELFVRHVKSASADFESTKRLNYQIVILLFKVLNHLKVPPEMILGEELVFFENLNSKRDFDSMLAYLLENTCTCIEAAHAPRRKANDNILDKVSAYIQKNAMNAISLESISAYLHISPEYFSRAFKKESGENFIDYITRIKMEKAKWILAEQKMTVAEVSLLVGYNSVKHFTKIFKKHTNHTPGYYSKKNLVR